MEELKSKFYKCYRVLSFIILTILSFSMIISTLVASASHIKKYELLNQYGQNGDIYKSYEAVNVLNHLYTINQVLFCVSLIIFFVYLVQRFFVFKDIKITKKKIIKHLPILVLALFLVWMSFGCIQVAMEVNAESIVRSTKNKEELPQSVIDIANWSSGDRAKDAVEHMWTGNAYLKDGIFSMLFYGIIFLNGLMLGHDEKLKKWIIRIFLIASLIFVSFVAVSFFNAAVFRDVVFWRRAIFGHQNHFGYYLSMSTIIALAVLLKDKNIAFKVIALISCFINIPVLVVNNTFGAYLGVLCGFIFLGIITLIRLFNSKFSKESIVELVLYVVVIIPFIVCSNIIQNADSRTYTNTKNNKLYTYSKLWINNGDHTDLYTFNSLTEEQAKEEKISNMKIKDEKLLWGTQKTTLEERLEPTIVGDNFTTFFKDIGIFYDHVVPAEGESGDTSGDISGDVDEEDISGEEIALITYDTSNLIEDSNETIMDWFGVSNVTSDELAKFDLNNFSNVNLINFAKYGIYCLNNLGIKTLDISILDDELSMIGSGRGKGWVGALDLINQRPVFGWGIESLKTEYKNQYGIRESKVHNIVLHTAAVTGIPGMLMYIGAIFTIFFKTLFDVKLRKFDKKGKIIISIFFILLTIVINLIVAKFTDKILINTLATVIGWVVLYFIIHTKGIHLRAKEFNYVEYITCAIFVSYFVSSLFGNTSFATSPLFMMFMGLLTGEMLNKKSIYKKEEVNKE